MRTAAAFLCLVAACACVKPPEFIFEKRVGLARWREGRGCMSAFNSSVPIGAKVVLVDQPASTGEVDVITATVAASLTKSCDNGLDNRNNSGVAPSFYRLETAGTPGDGIMFAILDPPTIMAVMNGRAFEDLDGDGANELFYVCNSAENVHFMIWTGTPADKRPRWRGMYYVGYDMTPTCTDDEIAGMVALDKARPK